MYDSILQNKKYRDVIFFKIAIHFVVLTFKAKTLWSQLISQ